MVANDLITRLNAQNIYTIGYADDLTVLITGLFANTICERTQAAPRVVERWCLEYNLTANPSKTEMVLFTNKRNLGNLKLPKLFNTELKLSPTVKYLGVILDSKLNWNCHLDSKLKKASTLAVSENDR